MKKKEERIEWIDIARVIGMLGVLAGHIFMNDTFIYKAVHVSNMPVFFFISGFLYKKKDQKDYAINKARSFILPYFSIFMLLYPILCVLLFSYDISIDRILSDIQYYIMGGRPLMWHMEHAFAPMWFLTCLFLTQITYNFISHNFSKRVTHGIIIMMLVLSYINQLLYPSFWLFWCANVVSFSIVIFHIGHLFRQMNFDIDKYSIFILIAGTLSFLSVIILPNNLLGLAYNYYGIPILTLICSIFCILMIRCIAIFLLRFKPLYAIFRRLGQASLCIMAFQMPIYLLLWKYFQLSAPIAIALMIILSYLIYHIFYQFRITRFIFLGKKLS